MMATIANIDHSMLNQISVGIVFTVEDHIREMLDRRAKIYSHHHWVSKSSPGIMIAAFITNAKNSTVFALFQ
jgi:hypothetical protein